MITILPDPSGRPGIALARISGAASAAGRPGLRVLREGWDSGNLGPNGWQGEDVLLEPDEVTTDGADLLLTLGWSICAHLEASTYVIAVPAAGIQEPAIWPDIRPIRAAPRPRIQPVQLPPLPEPTQQRPPSVLSLPEPPPPPAATIPIEEVRAPPLTEPVVVEALKPAGTSTKPRGILVSLGLTLLVLLLLAGGAWFLYRPNGTLVAGLPVAPSRPDIPEPTRPPSPAPLPTTAPPVPTSAQRSVADMSVAEVLQQTHDMAAVTAEGQRRLANGKPDDGLLLLEESSDHGDAGAMAALGRLYDPVNFQLGHVLHQPDPRQSARYFHDAAQAHAPGIEADRQALRDWLEGRAHTGDVPSQLILRDFWQ